MLEPTLPTASAALIFQMSAELPTRGARVGFVLLCTYWSLLRLSPASTPFRRAHTQNFLAIFCGSSPFLTGTVHRAALLLRLHLAKQLARSCGSASHFLTPPPKGEGRKEILVCIGASASKSSARSLCFPCYAFFRPCGVPEALAYTERVVTLYFAHTTQTPRTGNSHPFVMPARCLRVFVWCAEAAIRERYKSRERQLSNPKIFFHFFGGFPHTPFSFLLRQEIFGGCCAR